MSDSSNETRLLHSFFGIRSMFPAGELHLVQNDEAKNVLRYTVRQPASPTHDKPRTKYTILLGS
jgi:hypothetical protein